jgi:hypothetical protein
MANTITSANAAFTLSIAGVFNTPVTLEGWGVDEAFDTELAEIAVVQVGVDGEGVGGFIPVEFPQTLTFLASSISPPMFDAWKAQQDAIGDIVYASGQIALPALGTKWTLSKGVLMRYSPLPNVRKVLQPRQFGLMWLPQKGIPAITSSPL